MEVTTIGLDIANGCSRLTWSSGHSADLSLSVVLTGLPRITPCSPMARLRRAMVQRASLRAAIAAGPCARRRRCLNETLFTSLPQARTVLAVWRHNYNRQTPFETRAGSPPHPRSFAGPAWFGTTVDVWAHPGVPKRPPSSRRSAPRLITARSAER